MHFNLLRDKFYETFVTFWAQSGW